MSDLDIGGLFGKPISDEQRATEIRKHFPLRRFKIHGNTGAEIVSGVSLNVDEAGALWVLKLAKSGLGSETNVIYAPGTWTRVDGLGLAEDA